jgi:hypothetical protein
MEKTSTLVNNVYTNAKEYIHLKTRSIKLEVYDKASASAASAVNGAVIAVLGLCAFLFLNVGLAYALSDAFNSTKWGFLALGGIYVVLIGIFLAVKGSVDKKIKNSIVTKMSKNAMTDYDMMVKEKDSVNAQLERAETLVKGNIEELKDNVDVLVEDFKKLKEDVQRFKHLFGHHDTPAGSNAQASYQQPQDIHHEKNGTLQKLAISTIVELIINRFVVKDVTSIKKAILPILAKVLVTTKIMNKPDGTTSSNGEGSGFIGTLKSKLAKFL